MNNIEILESVKLKAQKWLTGNYDEQTKNEVTKLLKSQDTTALIDAFYQDLEFGTGGLRGIMGVGTNRMNIYTVAMATQGLCNYLKRQFNTINEIKVAIAYDSRNNSKLFAQTTANVFAANNFKVYLFDSMRPTPILSFAIRHLQCQSGVVITASHNPKEYNGYKAYWNDGAQLIPPHDKNVIDEVKKIKDITEVKMHGNEKNIIYIGNEVDEAYFNKILSLSISPEINKKYNQIKIVFTPIHGTGVFLVPEALKRFGFTNIIHIPEQDIPDGNFPTTHSPNPEEAGALTLALEKAKQHDADLVLATDPDADRVGIAVKDHHNQWRLLNGNQTGSIIIYYLLSKWNEKNKLTGNEYIIKTIVTTELFVEIAKSFNVPYYDVLTGFKYIAEIIRLNEGKKTFIGGGEESYGYLIGDFVRDKDAIIASAIIAETLAFAKNQNKSLFELLIDIYCKYGFYKEKQFSLTKKGKTGQDEIKEMMQNYRNNPPLTICNKKVITINDYKTLTSKNLLNNTQNTINLPKSDVLQFILEDDTKISIRPSGTEPKIKFYFGVKEPLLSKNDFDSVEILLDNKIQQFINAFQLSQPA